MRGLRERVKDERVWGGRDSRGVGREGKVELPKTKKKDKKGLKGNCIRD